MPRAKQTKSPEGYFEKLENEIKSNNSPLSLILGSLIILVVGILVFNFFSNKDQGQINTGEQTQAGDVSPDKLPGKYIVKEGDTLFLIAEKYYKNGYKFPEIAKANNLSDVNSLSVGQVLEIPKIEAVAEVSPSPMLDQSETPAPVAQTQPVEGGKGGGKTTLWGPKIDGDSYTVVEGDWLSTISARAYNDIMAYTKIATANDIKNPDLIFPGQVLKLPR